MTKYNEATTSTTTTTSNAFIEEHWFTEDNNFDSSDLNSIIKNKVEIYIDYKFNLADKFAPNDRTISFSQKQSKNNV